MNCKQIQNLIPAFDKNQLTLKEEENFVSHMKECSDCKEELEIYYIFRYGFSEDDGETEKIEYSSEECKKLIQIYNFKELVTYKLNGSTSHIARVKSSRRNVKIVFWVLESSILVSCVIYVLMVI